MSVLGKKWIIKNKNCDKSILEILLENRGIMTVEEQEIFLNSKDNFHDPFLFRDMEKAIERISKAIKDNERIIIFGDYDVDGMSGTAILVHVLRRLKANVSYRLPNRSTDGYGLSEKFIDEFIEKEVKLIITVDCGISCNPAINKAKEHGIDTIITDHHTIPAQIPVEAVAILHPKESDCAYPFADLTGAGVALKLAHALIERFFPTEEKESFLNSLVDFASLGTIADLGTLKGENRLIVKRGLKNLENSRWAGLKEIMKFADVKNNSKIDTSALGFRIVPRINAAGRIGDPYLALSLLLQDEEGARAAELGGELERLNSRRQQMTQKALEEALNELPHADILPSIIIAESPLWHVGILGLVAGRLAEQFGRPAIIMQDLGDTLIGSARSPGFFNITSALANFKDLLITFGGHAQAAGFNIKKENLPLFKEKLGKFAEEKLNTLELLPLLEIDCEMENQQIDMDLFDRLEALEPYGVENRRPVFLLSNVSPFYVEKVGKEGDHLKFNVELNHLQIPVIGFRLGKFADQLHEKTLIDLVFHLEKDTWKNKNVLKLIALDFTIKNS